MRIDDWAWPDNDTGLCKVFDQVNDIDRIIKYVANPRICIQAGGACGVWPYRFAQLFNHVHTFEPFYSNYEYLVKNIEGIDNITAYNCALSDKNESGTMEFDKTEINNIGAAFFKPGIGDVRTKTIDSLHVKADLIQLDVEGYELEALTGAIDTIIKNRPVIVIEEKKLPQVKRDFKLARYFIEDLGYREVDRIHRDVIFC